MPHSTLGYEKLFNWALAETDEQRFVEEVLSGQPEPPAYFAIMKGVNRDGPPVVPPAVPPAGEADGITEALSKQATVVDTRPATEFAEGHLAGTINIPRNKSFLNWAGAILPYDRDAWFIAPAGDQSRRELANDLALIGFERIAGVFPSNELNSLRTSAGSIATPQIGVDDVRSRSDLTILDVRSRSEYAEGHLPNAVNIPLTELSRRVEEVPAGNVAVHCQGGGRSAIAASILQRNGRHDVANMGGGFTEWERNGNPVERGPDAGS